MIGTTKDGSGISGTVRTSKAVTWVLGLCIGVHTGPQVGYMKGHSEEAPRAEI